MATYDYLNQSIVSSTPIVAKNNDSFFHPTVLGHTGFASDGNNYQAGTLTSGHPSWFTESASSTRGIMSTFPQQAVVILSDVAMTVLAEVENELQLWMLSLVGDTHALPSTYIDTDGTSYSPTGVEYHNGVLRVIYTADDGSSVTNTFVIHVDLVQDQIYLEVADQPAGPPALLPALGLNTDGYLTAICYPNSFEFGTTFPDAPDTATATLTTASLHELASGWGFGFDKAAALFGRFRKPALPTGAVVHSINLVSALSGEDQALGITGSIFCAIGTNVSLFGGDGANWVGNGYTIGFTGSAPSSFSGTYSSQSLGTDLNVIPQLAAYIFVGETLHGSVNTLVEVHNIGLVVLYSVPA